MDLKSCYWQIEVIPNNQEKTTFTKGQGFWHFRVMTFGFCNALLTYERLVETVLRELSYEVCLVYLDDIMIVEHTFDEI